MMTSAGRKISGTRSATSSSSRPLSAVAKNLPELASADARLMGVASLAANYVNQRARERLDREVEIHAKQLEKGESLS